MTISTRRTVCNCGPAGAIATMADDGIAAAESTVGTR